MTTDTQEPSAVQRMLRMQASTDRIAALALDHVIYHIVEGNTEHALEMLQHMRDSFNISAECKKLA